MRIPSLLIATTALYFVSLAAAAQKIVVFGGKGYEADLILAHHVQYKNQPDPNLWGAVSGNRNTDKLRNAFDKKQEMERLTALATARMKEIAEADVILLASKSVFVSPYDFTKKAFPIDISSVGNGFFGGGMGTYRIVWPKKFLNVGAVVPDENMARKIEALRVKEARQSDVIALRLTQPPPLEPGTTSEFGGYRVFAEPLQLASYKSNEVMINLGYVPTPAEWRTELLVRMFNLRDVGLKMY